MRHLPARVLVLSSLLLACLLFGSPPLAASSDPLLIIVGLQFPSDDVRFSDVKAAFRGQPTKIAGKRVVPINHPIGSPLRAAFDRAILGLEPSAVGRYWVDRRIRDEGTPPTNAPTPELAVRVVATLNGAITYGSAAMLTPKVRALKIDGKAAGQHGYALAR
ncbi:MAG TPA: hypothetical protein VJR89_30355 [Polyangiales bacterium]|nr:hypothetical protein [Polyangiales bacterium]